MTKISRNANCPCGSGKKYKRCCLQTDEEIASASTVERTIHRSLAFFAKENEPDIDDLSNSVVALINTGALDAAEEVCMRLLREFPECVDGIMRLVAVHEAKQDFSLAADYARKTVDFMREREEDFDPALIADYEEQELELRRKAAEQS